MPETMNSTHYNRILVVDDTTANLQLLTNLLTEHGYNVYPASDGELALEFVRSTLPDLILLDIRMPGMDGYEVCRRLKADERTRAIPVIFISILEDERNKVKGFREGAVDYITKPFQSEEVLARVGIHLRLRELTERLEQKVAERTEELTIATEQLQQELAERKKAEAALRQSEALLNETQRLAKIGGWEWDVEHQTSFWTEETYRIHGMEPQASVSGSSEYIDRSLSCYDPADRPIVLGAFQRCVQQGEAYDLEFPFTSIDGFRKWIRTTATAVRENGRIIKVVGNIMDITERKQAEAELRDSEERLRLTMEAANIGTWDWDVKNDIWYVSPIYYSMLGYEPKAGQADRNEWLERVHPDDRDYVEGKIRGVLTQDLKEYQYEARLRQADGTYRWQYVRGFEIKRDEKGKVSRMLGIRMDITEQKQAEEERQSHLLFMESLDQINHAIQGTNDLEQMMSDVLGVALSVFNCDRAWLFYPCDPDAPSFRVPMEATKPEYPGAGVFNADVPMPPEIAQNLQEALESTGPLTYRVGTEQPVNRVTTERFGVQSQMLVALYPKSGKPWMFGLHQCSRARVWTQEERRLLKEIGRRLEDALTSLLSHRNLQESEQRYRMVFENSPVSIWEEDFSAVKSFFDDLKKQGVTDIETYFDQHPEAVQQCAELTKIIDVNQAALTLHAAANKDELMANLVNTFMPESFDTFRQELICLWNGGTEMSEDTVVMTLTGAVRNVTVSFSVCPDYKETLSKVIVSLTDITEQKRAEAISGARLHLMQFASTHSLDDFLEETLHEAEKLTQSTIGFYVFVEDDQTSVTLQNWSTNTKANFCKAEGKGLHYNISEAGVWVDCIIQGKPVIHNDYASLPNRKGMPEGRAELIRELVVPVLRGDKIKAVVAVGNKQSNYNETDVEALSLLADVSWEIAERKRAEEKILRSDQRLRLHSEQSPLGFLEWDDNFHAIEWNAACERIFGYTREEAIGRHAKDLILPVEVHELVDEIYHSLMNQTGGQHSINENITRDGRIITCEWFNTTLIDKDGKAIGVASVCRDITEQKRMEGELARYREHLEEQVNERTAELELARNKAQQYLDIAGVILVAINKNRRVTLINQKGCDVLGNTSREIVGKDWFETFVPENARQDVIQCFQQLMAGELEPVEYFENPVLTQGDEERLVAWHNVLLKDSEGNITGTLSSGEDITEKKRAEEHIIRLNQDLRHRAAALEAANKELEAFAYSVSHDLRAPLRHIDGFLNLLHQRIAGALDAQSQHYMDTIADAARRMGLLIDDLLAFSRMGRHELTTMPVDLNRLVQEVIRELASEAAGRAINWRIADLPVVTGDRAMLRIVFVNLIANALKFTRPRQPAEIEIGCLPGNGTETIVYVRDNGVGFDPNYVDKLFGVFQRLHHADEFEGTGIGLANVRRIIRRHGGRTWAEGQVNHGAAFYFALPSQRA